MKTPQFIIIHHSEAKDHGTLDWAGIKKWHVEHNGWRDIGYQWGIEKVGSLYQILVGRMPTDTGAHCKSKNRNSWGICLVGNFDITVPPKAQWDLAVAFSASLSDLAGIPIDSVLGHREGDVSSPKTCPGKNFDMDKFRHDIFDYKASHI